MIIVLLFYVNRGKMIICFIGIFNSICDLVSLNLSQISEANSAAWFFPSGCHKNVETIFPEINRWKYWAVACHAWSRRGALSRSQSYWDEGISVVVTVVSCWMSKLLVSWPVYTSKTLQYGHHVFSTAYAHSEWTHVLDLFPEAFLGILTTTGFLKVIKKKISRRDAAF